MCWPIQLTKQEWYILLYVEQVAWPHSSSWSELDPDWPHVHVDHRFIFSHSIIFKSLALIISKECFLTRLTKYNPNLLSHFLVFPSCISFLLSLYKPLRYWEVKTSLVATSVPAKERFHRSLSWPFGEKRQGFALQEDLRSSPGLPLGL